MQRFKTKIVAFEGVGGSGKTTQMKLIKSKLDIHFPEIRVAFLKEFTTSRIGKYLNSKIPKNSFRIYSTDYSKVFIPCLADVVKKIDLICTDYDLILIDRFYKSIIAHNLYLCNNKFERKIIIDSYIYLLNKIGADIISNTYNIFFNCSVETCINRLEGREGFQIRDNDIYFLQSLDKNYRDIINFESSKNYLLNSANPKGKVTKDLLGIIETIHKRS